MGQGDLAEFDVPVVSVGDAALQNGQLTIRRSPLLELRTLDHAGVTRTDLRGRGGPVGRRPGSEESPLGIRPFEAYSFVTVPFSLRLAAAPVAARVAATVQTRAEDRRVRAEPGEPRDCWTSKAARSTRSKCSCPRS